MLDCKTAATWDGCSPVNFPFYHIPKGLYLIEIWWLWRPLQESELIVMFPKPVCDDHNDEMVIKGWRRSAIILRLARVFKPFLIGTKGLKVHQETIPPTVTWPWAAWTVETRQDGSMLSCWLHHLSWRQRFSNLLLSSFSDPVLSEQECQWCGLLLLWSVFFMVGHVMCSAIPGCNKWLMESLLPFYHLEPVCPSSSDLSWQHGPFAPTASLDISLFGTILSQSSRRFWWQSH